MDNHFNGKSIMFYIFLNWICLDRLAEPLYLQKGTQYGAHNTLVGNLFCKTAPFQFGFCSLLNNFQIGPFWADWQTPFNKTACNMGPQILMMAILSCNRPHVNMDYVYNIVYRI